MMTKEQRQIVEKLKIYVGKCGSQNKAKQSLVGISPATVSPILKGNLQRSYPTWIDWRCSAPSATPLINLKINKKIKL